MLFYYYSILLLVSATSVGESLASQETPFSSESQSSALSPPSSPPSSRPSSRPSSAKKSNPQKGEVGHLPRNFRIANSSYVTGLKTVSQETREIFSGLENLCLSGSAQFSKLGLEVIVSKIRSSVGYQHHGCEQILVVNLREEFCFFRGEDQLEEEDIQEKDEVLLTENEVVAGQGLWYLHLPVTQGGYPPPAIVDQFLETFKTLPSKTWVHFHCRGGNGRTTTAMVLLDLLCQKKNLQKNADQREKFLPLSTFLKRHFWLGGTDLWGHPVAKALEKAKAKGRSPKEVAAADIQEHEERLKFLEAFYLYLTDAAKGFDAGTPWSQWKG